jgi:hypothetical protein
MAHILLLTLDVKEKQYSNTLQTDHVVDFHQRIRCIESVRTMGLGAESAVDANVNGPCADRDRHLSTSSPFAILKIRRTKTVADPRPEFGETVLMHQCKHTSQCVPPQPCAPTGLHA